MRPISPHVTKPGYADPDGYERVDAWRCEEGCVCEKLGQQSGQSETKRIEKPCDYGGDAGMFGNDGDRPARGHTDRGTAARFYHQSSWEHERAEMRCARDCPVAKLDEQAGERGQLVRPGYERKAPKFSGRVWNNGEVGYLKDNKVDYVDRGGASRFYHNADWSHEIAERLATEAPVRYCPKAARSERSKGLDDFYWVKDKRSSTGFIRVNKGVWENPGDYLKLRDDLSEEERQFVISELQKEGIIQGQSKSVL